MTAPVSIRRATAEDGDACERIHGAAIRVGTRGIYTPEATEAWATAFNRAGFARAIEEQEYFVAETDEGRVVGFVSLRVGDSEVNSFYVDPEWSERGIGSALLERVMEAAREERLQSLWLDASLNAAPFYLKHGWVETDRCSRVRKGIEIPCIRMGRLVR